MLALITDRTAGDVARLRELLAKPVNSWTTADRSEFNAANKGAYNYIDMNRVENAVQTLADLLNANGYPVEILSVKTNWAESSVPTATDLTRYLENVRRIRDAFYTLHTTPQVPSSMKGLTYDKANAIEQVLTDVDVLLNNMIASYTYSGDIFGGEV